MSSFLLFHETNPIGVQYTLLQKIGNGIQEHKYKS